MTLRHKFSLLTILLLLLAACGGGDGDAAGGEAGTEAAGGTEAAVDGTGTENGGAASAADADADLMIWADELRVDAMREIGQTCGQEQLGATVAVQEVAGEDIRSQLQQAGPAGEGPDLIAGAHDWVGELVTNGAITPVELQDADAFEQVAIEAFSWDGQLYGVPFNVENLALYRNTDLVPEAPETWQEVIDTAAQLQDSGEAGQGLVIPASSEESPYHFQPVLTGSGGYIFEFTDTGYDTSDVGLDNEGSIAAAQAIQEWVDMGVINPDMTFQIMQEQFGQGDAAFAVSGPWSLQQGGAGFQETGVNFEVDPFPTLDGNEMHPFVGAQGVMVSAFTDNQLAAQSFATECIGSAEGQMTFFESNPRPPALTEVLPQAQEQNPAMDAFIAAGANGRPLPAIPAMSTVFTAMGDAYTLIMQGEDPEQAMTNAAEQTRQAVQ